MSTKQEPSIVVALQLDKAKTDQSIPMSKVQIAEVGASNAGRLIYTVGTPIAQPIQAQIIVTPQPFKVDIDTPTDWPVVIAPLILGAAPSISRGSTRFNKFGVVLQTIAMNGCSSFVRRLSNLLQRHLKLNFNLALMRTFE